MKYQSGFPYKFHNHFDSPLWNYLNNPQNAELVLGLMTKWTENSIMANSLNSHTRKEHIQVDLIMSIGYGFPIDIKGDKVYASGLYLLIDKFLSVMSTKLQKCGIEEDVFLRIILGGMIHQYYTTGPYGEKLRDIMDIEYEANQKGELAHSDTYALIELRAKLIPLYTEPCSLKLAKAHYTVSNFINKVLDNKKATLNVDILQSARDVSVLNPNLLKFSKEGIAIVKAHYGDRPDIIKGFQQSRIKRHTYFDFFPLLSAIISAMYYDEELFLCFDPYRFDMGIYDRKHIQVTNDNPTYIFSFTNILHRVFCKDCIKKVFRKYDINFDKSPTKDNNAGISAMFSDILQMLNVTCPDNVEVTIEGKVNDTNRYTEIDEAVPYGKVSFDKHAGKKKAVTFTIQKNLKDYKKKVK